MRIVLTELLIDRLNAEKRRTGLAANALLANTPDIPHGLKPSTISSWFAKATKTADLDFFLFAIRAYARVQDPVANTKRPPAGAEDRIRISAEMRQTIRQVHETIPTWVLFGEDAPPGLTPVLMCRLTPKRKSGKRREKTIRKDVWEYLANLAQKRNCKALLRAKLAPDLTRADIAPQRKRSPKARVPSYAGVEYTPISDALYAHFHAEIRRTLVSPKHLLQTLDDCPKGLDHRMVANWLSGNVQSAERRYLDYLYFHYGLLPDADTAEDG